MTSISNASAPVRAIKAAEPTNDDVPIEPIEAAPDPTPFKMGVGSWIGMGAAALVVGGIAAIMGRGASYEASIAGTIAATAGAGLVGAAGGGLAAWGIAHAIHNGSEKDRILESHGTSTLQLARDELRPYDHNRNGSIDLTNTTGLDSQDERIMLETRRQKDSHLKYDMWNDEWRTETERWTETRGTSSGAIWGKADTAPKDGVMTDVELAHLMAGFDSDKSGALTPTELAAFKNANQPIVEEWRR